MVSRRWGRVAPHYEEAVWLFVEGLVSSCCAGPGNADGMRRALESVRRTGDER